MGYRAEVEPDVHADRAANEEDVWVVPPEWWQHVDPFRGLGPKPDLTVDPEAPTTPTELLARHMPGIGNALRGTALTGFPELSAAGRKFLDGQSTPLGAAVICVITTANVDFDDTRADRLVDTWVTEHGVVFAAEVSVWLAGMRVASPTGPIRHTTMWSESENSRVWHTFQATHIIRDNVAEDAWDTAKDKTLMLQPVSHPGTMMWSHVLRRVRAHLAAASDDQHRAAVGRLAELRVDPGAMWIRLATSYLAPTEQHWLDADLMCAPVCHTVNPFVMLAASATTGRQITRLSEIAGHLPLYHHYPNVLTQVGPEAAQVISDLLDDKLKNPGIAYYPALSARMLAGFLARFPTDQAFGLLLARADRRLPNQIPFHVSGEYVYSVVQKAMERFPQRAMKLLSQRAVTVDSTVVKHLFWMHVRAYPDIVSEPGRVDPVALRVFGLDARLPDATPDQLPTALVSPPWHSVRRQRRAVVSEYVYRPPTLRWLPGEQEQWALTPIRSSLRSDESVETWMDKLRSRHPYHCLDWSQLEAFAQVSADVAGPCLQWLAQHQFGWYPYDAEPYKLMLGRFGDDALGFAIAAASARKLTSLAPVLMPADGTDVTLLMMLLLTRKRQRWTALTWFDRHVDTAAIDIVAFALGKQCWNRTLAENALHVLAERGHAEVIDRVAASLGETARATIFEVLHRDPLLWYPERIPRIPDWLIPSLLPPIRLRDLNAVFPESAVTNLVTMLQMYGRNGDYAGVPIAIEAADPTSLSEFEQDLSAAWQFADCPHNDIVWVRRAQRLLSGDRSA
ncbi:hypothetical protein OH799_33430 [Nocardia sp. NBC_00881]|uniref:hypothetical protein n=1 Tax=Nocardia sp. NBC_00881 TaxID=2975995 RepID=UPI0038678D23|nr:hypothetical protein OH799_33430 [Nocardia sp. NBC_00881]